MIGASAAVRSAAALGERPTGHEPPPIHEHLSVVLPPLADAALETAASIGEQSPLDGVAPPRVTGVHATNLRPAGPQRQRVAGTLKRVSRPEPSARGWKRP